jgi:hypothetical protein
MLWRPKEVQNSDLGTKWVWEVNFTLRVLYFQRNSQWYILDMGLGVIQRQFGLERVEKHLDPRRNLTPIIQPIAIHYKVWATPAYMTHQTPSWNQNTSRHSHSVLNLMTEVRHFITMFFHAEMIDSILNTAKLLGVAAKL